MKMTGAVFLHHEEMSCARGLLLGRRLWGFLKAPLLLIFSKGFLDRCPAGCISFITGSPHKRKREESRGSGHFDGRPLNSRETSRDFPSGGQPRRCSLEAGTPQRDFHPNQSDRRQRRGGSPLHATFGWLLQPSVLCYHQVTFGVLLWRGCFKQQPFPSAW